MFVGGAIVVGFSVVVGCAVGSIKYHLRCFVLKIQIHEIHSVSCDSVQ